MTEDEIRLDERTRCGMSADTAKGYALRVGNQVLVPPNATDADIAAALDAR